jgi:phage/plasmid-like protein (TIGR03299 family)
MSHEIENTDVFVEVRVNGDRAWHGLGNEIAPGLGARKALKEARGDWTTSLQPLYSEVVDLEGNPTRIEIPTHRAHVRDDTTEILGIVGSGYRPIENTEVCEFADALTDVDKGIEVETLGTLRGGRRFYVLCKLDSSVTLAGGDHIRQYVLLSNGHGGCAAFQGYMTDIRVVCANTLRWSERSITNGFRFEHSGDIDGKLREARRTLGIVTAALPKREKLLVELAATSPRLSEVKEYFVDVFECTEKKMDDSEERQAKILAQWLLNMDHPNQLGEGSYWTAYNAVSQWLDHERGRYKGLDESDSRIHPNLFGVSDRFKRVAFDKAVALI